MLNKMRLLTPGPTPLPEKVRLALALDMIHHRKPEFKAVMLEVQQKLRRLFGTSQEVLPLACSGTGALVASMQGLFAPGEKVLVVQGGKFGERWVEIAASHGIAATVLMVPEGCAVEPAAVEAALQADPEIRGVFVQLCETSTGVQHPVREIAAITSKSSALLVVDGISGVGITPCPMDEWQLDCLLTGSQKGLMLPPGLTLLALSPRAWAKAESVKSCNYYFNLPLERANIVKGQTAFTPAIGLLVGLNESMNLFMEAGLENIYRKQWALCSMARTGIEAMGLRLFAPDHFAWGVTSVCMPGWADIQTNPADSSKTPETPGLKASAVLAEAAAKFNVVMAGGQGAFKDRIVRVGHMGWIDWADLAAGLHALYESCNACGAGLDNRASGDYLEKALAAYWRALKNGYII
ncbi:MAG: alanine--glyoxylate aminotransferase family protein [Deltaproteobacteria bacterium]|jgi:aspartate aminotransferase-like enzyme|nr:alanine--glyoxylate aminotransferase family protein [Deltaproteobacteria bacterium]